MQTKLSNIIFRALLIISAFFAILVYGITVRSNGDNIEHLHESWLIWKGLVPYRDFFQHHNPLIWYIFSPLVALLINSKHIFMVFNIISVFITFGIVFYMAEILKKCGVKNIFRIILGCIFLSSYSGLYSTDFRPDTLMYLFLFIGIDYLFRYLDENKLSSIVISFFSLFLSFLSSQKIILNMVIIVLFIIYALIKNKIKKQDFLYAIILPILCLVFFLCYLYVNDALSIYIKSNYLFNAHIPLIFKQNRIVLPPLEYYEFYVFVPISIVFAILLFKKGDIKEKFLSVLFFEELGLRLFYFSAFLHYNVLLLMLSIMIFIIYVGKYFKLKDGTIFIFIAYILFSLGYIYKNAYLVEKKRLEHKTNYEYVFENTNFCDYVINGYYAVYNLKSKDPGFYSILLGQIDVLGDKLNIAPKDNLNELIVKYKPKIISSGIYWNTYLEERGRKNIVHWIDRDILNKYYNPTPVGDLYMLKKEYQKNNCVFDGNTWRYED